MFLGDPPYIISPDPSCSPGTCPALANLAENRAPGDFIYKVEAANHYNYNDVINPDLTYILTNDTCSAFDIDLVTGKLTTLYTGRVTRKLNAMYDDL